MYDIGKKYLYNKILIHTISPESGFEVLYGY